MAAFSNDSTYGNDQIIKGWDWAALGKATVVDAGGGIGTFSKDLAKAFPSLNFIVQDLP